MYAQNRLGICLRADLIADQHLRRQHTERCQQTLCPWKAVQHIGVQSHIILRHAVVYGGDLAALIHQCEPPGCPQKAAKVTEHCCLARPHSACQKEAGWPLRAYLPEERLGTAGHRMRDPKVQTADVAHLHQFSLPIDCRPGNAHPVAAGNGHKALGDLFRIAVDGIFAHRLECLLDSSL